MPTKTRNFIPAWRDPWLLAILAVGAFLIFCKLGDRPLWQDEAETACLAKNVLKTGLPMVWDGKNLISQEEGREYGADNIWRWSPWMQIYLSAAGLAVSPTTAGDRFPFALAGLAAILLTFLMIRDRFKDRNWALLSAALLTLSPTFILFCRQGRYYSVGALIFVMVMYGFLGDWRKKTGPLLAVGLGMGLMFHANYLLLLSLAPPLLVVALLLYRQDLAFSRIVLIFLIVSAMAVPGLYLYRVARQSGMFEVMVIPENWMLYFADWVMYMIPLPVLLALALRWRGFFFGRGGPADPGERFCLALALIMVGGFAILGLIPQRFHRYIVHFYPACAVVLAWVGLKLWRFSKPCGVVFLLLVGLTNWLNIIPMERLKIVNRPWENDFRMLTSANIPLKLHLTELFCGYPGDVTANIINFFNTRAKPGQTILAEYDDLPLQFYTPFRVIGGLQGPVGEAEKPDWLCLRRDIRVNRDGVLFGARQFVIDHLDLARDYDLVENNLPDETFGDRPDPDFHYFTARGGPQKSLLIYKRKEQADAP